MLPERLTEQKQWAIDQGIFETLSLNGEVYVRYTNHGRAFAEALAMSLLAFDTLGQTEEQIKAEK